MRDNDLLQDSNEPGNDSPGIDWQEYYHAVRERRWILLLCVVLAAIGAAMYMSRQHLVYRTRSVLGFEQAQPKVLEKVQGVEANEVIAPDVINTVVDQLAGYSFAQRVAERLKLQEDPRFLADVSEKGALPLTADDAAGFLLKDVTPSYRMKTRLIDIVVTHPNASLAKELANAYADEYILLGLDRRAAANKAAAQYLLDEAERLRRQMRVSEEAMQSFRERARAASPEKMQQESEGKLDDLSRNITATEDKLFQLDNDLKAASAAAPGDTATLLRLPSIAAEPAVAAVNQAIADQERQFTLLKETYRAKHPIYIAAVTQLASLNKSRNQILQDSVGLLRGERQRLEAQRDELKQVQQDQQSRLLSATGQSVEYNDLKRALETNTAMYNSILSRIAEIDVTKGLSDLPVQVHERAVGAVPVGLSPVKVYLGALALGLAAGLGIAVGLHLLDRSIKTIDQAERLTGLPVLAAVPKKPKSNARTIDVATERKGIVAEAFRSLRTSLAMGLHAEERRTFLFTSAMPSEGKTFCSTNFAATLGQQGLKTLIIDADLRRPMVSRVFFGQRRNPGLIEVLAGQVAFADAVIASEVENVSVLTAGSEVVNPTELLAGRRFRDLLKDALLVYERVVIDSAPTLAVSDSLLVAPHVDAVCLVMRSFKTPRRTVARALKALREIKCEPVGVVLNYLPTGTGSYYYYSGKYYGSYSEKNAYGA